MAEDKKEKWMNGVALSTILFAVCATLSTFKGGQYSTKTVLYQLKVANEWAYYQAKDMKGYLHELQKDKLELDLLDNAGHTPGYADAARKRIEAYADKIKKYDAQRGEIEQKARSYETAIVDSQAHGQNFGMAVIFLQIAILLSSVAALMKKIKLWYGGLVIGSLGLLYFANGFSVFF